jgi:hypothetical protein
MADEKQLRILKRGVEAWNNWRREHENTDIDLSKTDLTRAYLLEADLSEANLIGANLSEAYLRNAYLWRAGLSGADLRGANLRHADLCSADLRGANLRGADLGSAYLSEADLSEANLFGANLTGADLIGADLTGALLGGTSLNRVTLTSANLSKAKLLGTVISDVDLSTCKNLDLIDHEGPSPIDIRTLQRSGQLPLVFLRGVGLPDRLIEYLPDILGQAIQFFSCFISYSHIDRTFARRLHDQLQGQGIRCWLDEHQILPGDDIYEGVDLGIRLWDKVLLWPQKHHSEAGGSMARSIVPFRRKRSS